MLKIAANFYKNLFGYESKLDVHLEANFWETDEKVTAIENNILDSPFPKEEIREAIFGSYADGPPSPDGFRFIFYQ